jgi:hypothetical protein
LGKNLANPHGGSRASGQAGMSFVPCIILFSRRKQGALSHVPAQNAHPLPQPSLGRALRAANVASIAKVRIFVENKK